MPIDRAAIFSSILQRNALRREARLPVREVRSTFEGEVRQALWREHVSRNITRIQAEVQRDWRKRFGSDPQSAGGRMAIRCLVLKALEESFSDH